MPVLYGMAACWQRDETDIVKRLADALLDSMEKELFGRMTRIPSRPSRRICARSRSSRGKEAMLKEAQHLDGIPVTPNMFDRHKGLLNVANGTVRLRTGEVQEHRREDYLTRIAPVEYSAGTACPMWEKFIGEITGGDAQLAHYLQVMVGYMLSGSTQEQCVFFLYGDGANGKSTFLDTLAAMLGDYAMNAQAETLMEKNRSQGGARSDIAPPEGRASGDHQRDGRGRVPERKPYQTADRRRRHHGALFIRQGVRVPPGIQNRDGNEP